MKTKQPGSRAKYLFGLVAMMYPLLVFCALVIFNLPIRYLSIGIIIFAIIYIAINAKHYKGKHTAMLIISPLILISIGTVSLFFDAPFVQRLHPALANLDSGLIIKLYPALADLAYVTLFTTSFFIPPVLAYYFIEVFDFTLKNRIPRECFERYCFKATLVWIVFFVIDGGVAVLTAFFSSDLVWAVYNTGVSYVIMGVIFIGEYLIIKKIGKKYRCESTQAEERNVNS